MPANQLVLLDGHTIAGLIDAEAHFCIEEHNGGGSLSCRMVLAMRDDDVALLHAAARTTSLGIVTSKDQRGNPQAAWDVYRKDDASTLAAYLKRFPMRSRKRQDFVVWNEAVELWCGTAADRVERMQELRHAIRDARRYVAIGADERLPNARPPGSTTGSAGSSPAMATSVSRAERFG